MRPQPMDDATKRYRADKARQFLADPLIIEAFDGIEYVAIEELLKLSGAWPWADRKRRMLIDRINAVRELRQVLEMAVAHGNYTSSPPQKWT